MKLFLRCLLMGLISPLAMAETASYEPAPAALESLLSNLKSSGLTEAQQQAVSCKLHVLGEMGWKFETNEQSQTIKPETDIQGCPSSSPILGIPAQISDYTNIERDLNVALTSDPTFCQYKQRLAIAGFKATTKIYNNKNFGFRNLRADPLCTFNQTGAWSGDPNSILQPIGSPCAAIQALYEKSARTECGVGLIATMNASQYELYGCTDFDRAFTTAETSVGPWDDIFQSENIISGTARNKYGVFYEAYNEKSEELHPGSDPKQYDPGARNTAAKGKLALIGLSGYIGYREDSHLNYLDDRVNKGQNFLIVSTTDAGAEALARRGTDGYDLIFDEVLKRTQKIFFKTLPNGELDRDVNGELKKRNIDPILDNWLNDSFIVMKKWLDESATGSPIPALPAPSITPAGMDEKAKFNLEKDRMSRLMNEIMILLNDRFLRDTQVAVHPHPHRSLGYYALFQLDKNRRIPLSIELYGSTVNSLLFTRYLEYKIEQCKTPQ